MHILLLTFHFFLIQILLPVNIKNRKDISQIQLTAIGQYGLIRKERKTVPSHLHTGIDIKRPNNNYINEPVFPLMEGKVISKRTDGAYAQLIIEHTFKNKKIWTVYEHIAGIVVNVNEIVNPQKPIARYMSKVELNKYGWQFDHFHLELLKVAPIPLKYNKFQPDRHFNSYTLICFSEKDLENYFYNPMSFFKNNL